MSPTLLADKGAAAATDDFFRSPQFLAAEGATHTLLIETPGGAQLAAPLIVRDIPGGDERDAISPYAYPGFTLIDAPAADGAGAASDSGNSLAAPPPALDPAALDWGETGLVSIFIRHRLGAPPPLAGATARNLVLISDPELPRKSRMSDRQQIRKNLRAGFEVTVTPGPEVTDAQRQAFLAAYTETMRRTQAAPRYFFDDDYFRGILAAPSTWLFLIAEPGGEIAAGSIAVRSDDMLHYYLSGTADAHLRGAPMKNILAEMTDFAWGMELPLNLGGGIKPGDPLEEFKRGFANREERLRTSELVTDPEAYRRLCERAGLAGAAAGDFFPAYRATA